MRALGFRYRRHLQDRLAGSPNPSKAIWRWGWIAGVILFSFFCRYIWARACRAASRRAAAKRADRREMILETAVLNVRPGQEAEFEIAMAKARALIVASPGRLAMEVRRCLETPNRYMLLVQWRTLEDHTHRVPPVAAHQEEWRNLLHHFYDPPPQVEHYAAPLDLV